jgi:hypothetical protein
MPKVSEQEREYDRNFLEQMGITANKVVYPEPVSTDDEFLELQWRIMMARS